MLVGTLTRVTPGRAEATLALVTIAPLRNGRGADVGRFAAHICIGPADERDERHVEISGWDSDRPAVELLRHVLDVASAEHELETDHDVSAVTMPAAFAAQLGDLARAAIDAGLAPGMTSAHDAATFTLLLDDLAEKVQAAA